MDIFKLVGSIFIKDAEANEKIDGVGKKAKHLAESVGGAVKKAGDGITNVGKALAPVSAVMTGALVASTKSASDFQNGMAKMSTLFDTTKTSVSDLSKEFLTLSNKTGLSATELAEAGYQAMSAGVSVENASKFVETAGNLAKAGFTSSATAVDVLTTAINAYGMEQSEAENIANKLVRTQNLGKTTVDELASSMGAIIPTASSMNVGIDNLTSGYVALTKQGIATAEATTYMRSMMNELGDSGTTVGKILKENTGKSFQELMAGGASLADVLKILQDDAKKSGTNFNELWSSSEAGSGALSILGLGVEEFNSTVETMGSKTNDVADALTKLETPSVKVEKSMNQVKNAGIQLGTAFITALLPILDGVSSGVEKLTTWFTNLDDGTKTVIAVVMSFIAILSPLLVLLGTVIGSVGTIITNLPILAGGVKSVGTGFKAFFTILKAHPIGIIITVITALIAVFIHLWNTSDEFRAFWINLWNKVKSVVSNGANSVKNTFNKIVNSVKGSINNVKSTISNGMNNAKNAVSNALNNIKNKFTSVMNNAKNTVSNAISNIKSKFNFKWSLPKLKMPHPKITGKFSLNPPSVPKFSIEWYRKAMNEPYMFTKPTLFNVNPLSGTAKGAGEAGDEIMYGRSNLMKDISDVVSGQNSSVVDAIMQMIDILSEYLPSISNMQVVTDTGVLVGELAPKMDKELGRIKKWKGRE